MGLDFCLLQSDLGSIDLSIAKQCCIATKKVPSVRASTQLISLHIEGQQLQNTLNTPAVVSFRAYKVCMSAAEKSSKRGDTFS